MTFPINVSTDWLIHDGGTKFYEIVSFTAPDVGIHLVVRRWGKMTPRGDGGETKVESFTSSRLALRHVEDLKLQKGKRGYKTASSMFGLNGMSGSFTANDLWSALQSHYSIGTCREIAAHFPGSLKSESGVTVILDELAEMEQKEKAVEPEPDRGEGWGSW